MKHTRLLALLTAALLLFAPVAQATNHIAYFHQPEGSEMYALSEIPNAVVPEGLEELYALFSQGNPEATVYVFRMPGGQALLSISCLETGAEGSTEVLYEQREALAQGLMDSLGGMMTVPPTFELTDVYGQQAITAPVTLYIPEVISTQIQVEGRVTAFYRGEDLIEVWTAYPGKVNYLFDQEATAALDSDLTALSEFEATLDFALPEEETETADSLQDFLNELEGNTPAADQPEELPHMTVTADDGAFRMDVPLDTMILHAGSDANTVARARALFADIKGGEECFDLWYEEVVSLDGWLLLSREYGVVAQVYVNDVGSFAGMSAQDMLLLEQPVLEMMKENFDQAAVADESSIAELDGMEHAWFTYDLYKGDMSMLSFVLAAVDEANLYELDIYAVITETTDEDTIVEIISMMINSLDYLPEMGV